MKTSDRVIRFLTGQYGATEVNGRSRKYRQFKSKNTNYFVGKNGAVRAGDNASSSISITNYAHKLMHLWEKKNNLPT